MGAPQTLAEFLGMSDDPEPKPLGVPLEQIVDGKAFGTAVLNSVEFRSYILMGLRSGVLPGFASILGRLIDHAIGKAPDRLQFEDKTVKPEDLTPDQLEERAAMLCEMASFMRRAERFDEPPATDSVH